MGIVHKLYFGLMTIAAFVTLSATAGIHYAGPIAVALGLLSALALFFVIKRSIADPIDTLLTAANEFSKGNFQYRILDQRKDELGALSQAFNRMGDDLQTALQFRLDSEVTSLLFSWTIYLVLRKHTWWPSGCSMSYRKAMTSMDRPCVQLRALEL